MNNVERGFFIFFVLVGTSVAFLMVTLAVFLIGGMAGWWEVD